MTKLRFSFIGLSLLIVLSKCSSAPPALENSNWLQQQNLLQKLNAWEMEGKVNVRFDNESYTPRIRWLQQDDEYRIRLWGAFNIGNTTIAGGPGRVTLAQGNDVLKARSPERLIERELGFYLPVSHLRYWVKGLPVPRLKNQLQFNELKQLSSLTQDGWTINYSDYRQYNEINLPSRIDLSRTRNDITLRFVRLSWTFDKVELATNGPAPLETVNP